MNSTRHYDGELQMFCEPVHEVDLARLRFLRWMVEQGKLEHDASGEPTGEYAGLQRLIGEGTILPDGSFAEANSAPYPPER
jgi:hypothetical protein